MNVKLFDGYEDTKAVALQRVFTHWVTTLKPNSRVPVVLSEKRKRKILQAIDLYGADVCIDAINGCTLSDFHMGRNKSGKKYDDIELILRDSKHIEMFAEMWHDSVDSGF